MLLPFLAHAQLESYARFNKDGTVEPNFNYSASKKITEQISLTFFGLVEQNWSEALVGLKYSPTKIVTFSGTIGIEHGTTSPRYSASVWTEK